MPVSKNDDKLPTSIEFPIFSLFKIIYQYEDKCKKCLQNLLKLVFNKLSSITTTATSFGYMLLYFLKVYPKLQLRKNPNTTITFKTNVYKILCDHLDQKIDTSLPMDLQRLEQESTQIFLWLLPDIFREFKSTMINNSQILQIICGCIDAKNIRDIIYNVTQGKLQLLKNEGIIDCIRESLNYETLEQYYLWQLVQAHDIPLDYLQVFCLSFFFFFSVIYNSFLCMMCVPVSILWLE